MDSKFNAYPIPNPWIQKKKNYFSYPSIRILCPSRIRERKKKFISFAHPSLSYPILTAVCEIKKNYLPSEFRWPHTPRCRIRKKKKIFYVAPSYPILSLPPCCMRKKKKIFFFYVHTQRYPFGRSPPNHRCTLNPYAK